MFLKSLSLKGFKSFAEATTLDLEPGVTVVVGPNGSGKSNVVDAIAWVLGAQAPSAVRSQKMDDVIFAGTATRPALGRAEVALTIDNSAGLLGIELTEVTVRRTLFRTGDSEYAINNVPCRLLDVQELLSDAGVGRQQHVIVSQGQIDAVLSARPEERRAIIEEAAGVLKYRKRREKAQRRLEATEGSLVRVQDLLREVRRQLRPLERQAEAAKRHGELIGELTALRIHLAGRELAALRTQLASIAAVKVDTAGEESRLKGELARFDAEVVATTAELTARGAEDLGDQLGLVEQLRERARGLAAVIAERRRSLERDRGQLLDAGVVANLESEAASGRHELAAVQAALEALAPQLATIEDARPDQAADAGAGGDAAEVRGELRTRRAALERASTELSRAGERAAALGRTALDAEHRSDRCRHDCNAAELVETPLVEDIRRAEERLVAAENERERGVVARQEAMERAAAAAGRAEALQLALDAVHARAGAERLSGLSGVLGTLLDLVRIDDGWETAVEAALGEALSAVVVIDPAAAERALQALRESDTSGAVLALGLTQTATTPSPPGGDPVRPHVTSQRPGVELLLDRLLAGAVRVDDVAAAADLAARDCSLVVVTTAGERFATTGWRVGATGAGGVTAAAVDEATTEAQRLTGVAERCASTVDTASEVVAAARRQLDDLRTRLAANDQVLTAASEGLVAASAERREAVAELEPLLARIDELEAHVASEQASIAELERVMPDLEARATAFEVRRRDLEARRAGLRERAQLLTARIEDAERRLAADSAARAAAEQQRMEVERALGALERLGRLVIAHRGVLDAHHGELVERRRQQSEEVRALTGRLDELRAERAGAERELDEVRERSRRAEVEEAEARLRLESAVELLRHDLDVEPESAEATPAPPLVEGVTARARVRDLEREVRLLGPINPLALEEFSELQQRHGFLEEQLEDVRTTRRELMRVIRAVDEEIQSVFAAAFVDVAANFERLFITLFPGGAGKLVLTDPADLLETGVDVEAKPSGKNVKKLSLLSGGERSLTALAFLFAVFRSRPSPFYVMDEVEAALDDVNLHRFLGLIAEFRQEAQLLIVSHQKRTMEAGDCLLGVTMQPGGSSRVITERVSASAQRAG